jgi:class 3 adenylate cyclase
MGETLTATFLFADLVGSTRLRSIAGDDRADGIHAAHDRAMEAAVVLAGGQVVKRLGDGVMAIGIGEVEPGVTPTCRLLSGAPAHSCEAPTTSTEHRRSRRRQRASRASTPIQPPTMRRPRSPTGTIRSAHRVGLRGLRGLRRTANRRCPGSWRRRRGRASSVRP